MKVGNLKLDIQVCDCSSCYNLVVQDHSYYLTTPEKPRLEIIMPGYETPMVFNFEAEKTNIFNSYSLLLSASAGSADLIELPDGLYQLTYRICPYEELYHTICHIRNCKAWCRWEKLLVTLTTSCYDLDPKMRDSLEKIEWLLKGSEALAKDCQCEKASEAHQKAIELLEDLECLVEKI